MKLILSTIILLSVVVPCVTNAVTDDQLTQSFHDAVAAGMDTTAMDLLCQIKMGVACGRADPTAALYQAEAALWHRRYAAAFEPPKNADWLVGCAFGDLVLWSSFNRDGVASRGVMVDSVFTKRYAPGLAPEGPAYMVVQSGERPRIVFDVDLDGQSDAVFDGTEVREAEGLEIITERASDGRRAQWLIGPAKSTPREFAQIWIYRDGCIYTIFFDTDGDGHGNCSYWGQLPSGRPDTRR